MKERRRKNKGLKSLLSAFRQKNGKPVKSNASVKMSLKSLRRLVSAAKAGRPVKVKARMR